MRRLLALLLLVVAGCSGGDGGSDVTSERTEATPAHDHSGAGTCDAEIDGPTDGAASTFTESFIEHRIAGEGVEDCLGVGAAEAYASQVGRLCLNACSGRKLVAGEIAGVTDAGDSTFEVRVELEYRDDAGRRTDRVELLTLAPGRSVTGDDRTFVVQTAAIEG